MVYLVELNWYARKKHQKFGSYCFCRREETGDFRSCRGRQGVWSGACNGARWPVYESAPELDVTSET